MSRHARESANNVSTNVTNSIIHGNKVNMGIQNKNVRISLGSAAAVVAVAIGWYSLSPGADASLANGRYVYVGQYDEPIGPHAYQEVPVMIRWTMSAGHGSGVFVTDGRYLGVNSVPITVTGPPSHLAVSGTGLLGGKVTQLMTLSGGKISFTIASDSDSGASRITLSKGTLGEWAKMVEENTSKY